MSAGYEYNAKGKAACFMSRGFILSRRFYLQISLDGERMKTFVIKEYDVSVPTGAEVFDLSQIELRHCTGCWSCWLATPGRCVHRDLDEYYRAFLAADKVYYYCKVSDGFVTSNMKAMIDRMIPLVLPYIYWPKEESLHDPRYDKYPAVEVIYRGEFLPGEEEAFISYWKRTLEMMFVKDIDIKRCETAVEATI